MKPFSSMEKADLLTECIKLTQRLKGAEQENAALAAHVERLSSAADAVCNRDLIRPEIRELDQVLAEKPETSLARLKAQAVKEFAAEMVEACKTNGHPGESFGMAISGPTECSDVGPCLKAARAVFREVERLADWRCRQAEELKS